MELVKKFGDELLEKPGKEGREEKSTLGEGPRWGVVPEGPTAPTIEGKTSVHHEVHRGGREVRIHVFRTICTSGGWSNHYRREKMHRTPIGERGGGP